MAVIVADAASEYSMRAALREAKFSEYAINHAMHALFPSPEDDQNDGDEPIDLAENWEMAPGDAVYVPTPEDWRDYAAWSLELEHRRDYIEAMERADVQEAVAVERDDIHVSVPE